MSATSSAADLNVTRVTLYKHGVGYFERAGDIPAGESATLQFQAEEMDDVLKSLTIEQRGGEGVSAVRYDSSDPLSKRLEVFPFRLGDNISLSAVLDQFKGAEVTLQIGGREVAGRIVSARTLPATQNESGQEQLVLLADGALQTVDPFASAAIRFADPKIQTQFNDYLSVLSRSRNTDKRTVTIESQGGAARIAAGYITPTPIWKSSYRLIFDKEPQPLLEGWAIVDNTSGEDWENVRLSLVSGLPVSFINRLYEPRYLQRPVVQLAQDRAWAPKIHGGAIEEPESDMALAKAMPAPPPAPMAEARAYRQSVVGAVGGYAGAAMADESFRNEISSTVAATAVKAELGDLFEYAIDHPVTIRKSESAMLPFFRERVQARRLYIYDADNGSQHPLRAAEITNSAGATLDGGAITVYDAGAYAGEALVETIKAGDKRLISYAVDLGTRITTAFDSSSKLQSEFHFRRGVITTKVAQREVKTFTIRNVDPNAKKIILEHPVRPGYNLLSAKPAETTADAYRFEVDVEPNATRKFEIVEERVYSQQQAVTNMSYQQLLSWVNNKDLSAEGRQQLERIAALKRQIADAEAQQQNVEQEVGSLDQDQNRLRSNISTLRSVPGQEQQVQQYSQRLSAQETRLIELRDQQATLRNQTAQLQTQLNNLIETMEF
ncbi:MAG: hypothetical protein GC160_27120 [Acidobacteria bacterium]|nr:hypothetical protein [Acidobacteriota bacterium]